jgi:hypothetical protein
MKALVFAMLVLGVVSCRKDGLVDRAAGRETLTAIKDKIMHSKLDCQKARADSEADMDRLPDDKVQAAELEAIEKCIEAFESAGEFVEKKMQNLNDSLEKIPEGFNYWAVAQYYLWATGSYADLWRQRLECEKLPLDGSLDDDYACAERAEALEVKANRLWRYAEKSHNALGGREPAKGGKK